MKLAKDVKTLQGKPWGENVFLLNPRAESWVAITQDAYQYLVKMVEQGADPVALGLQMGFNQQEITQFLSYLFSRGILIENEPALHAEDIRVKSCYFHVTQVCNLQCRTCYSWRSGRNSRQNELSLAQAQKALEQLANLGLQQLIISGGEPLTRKDLPEILRFARETLGIEKIAVITNGTLVTPEKADALIPWVDEFSVSLDGPNNVVNAVIRGDGNFARAIRGVRTLQERGAQQVSLLATLTHSNLRYLDDFLALANELNTGISFSMFVGIGAGALPGTEDLALTPKDLAHISHVIMQNNIPIDMDVMLTSVGPNADGPQEIHLQAKDNCGAGHRILSIDYDGGVYPCHMLMKPSLRMGTLPHDDLQTILSDTPLGKFFRGVTVDGIQTCQQCDLRYFCGGGCRASAYAKDNDLLAHDPACALYKTAIHDMLQPIL